MYRLRRDACPKTFSQTYLRKICLREVFDNFPKCFNLNYIKPIAIKKASNGQQGSFVKVDTVYLHVLRVLETGHEY